MGILRQRTKFDNKTDLPIDLVVDGGICPLRSLRAGKSGSVSLSRIRKQCIDEGSPDWPIRVLINNRCSGIKLHPLYHIMGMTRIVFRYKFRPDASRIPIAEGVFENWRDRHQLLNYYHYWDNKIYVEIAEADSTWRSVREREVATVAAPWIGLMNNPQSSFAAGTFSSSTVGQTENRRVDQRNVDGGIPSPSSVIRSGQDTTVPVTGSGRDSTVTNIRSRRYSGQGRNSTVSFTGSGRDSTVPDIRSMRNLGHGRNSTVFVTGSGRDSTVRDIRSRRNSGHGRNSTVSVTGSGRDSTVPNRRNSGHGRNSTVSVTGSGRDSLVPDIRSRRNSGHGRNFTVSVTGSGSDSTVPDIRSMRNSGHGRNSTVSVTGSGRYSTVPNIKSGRILTVPIIGFRRDSKAPDMRSGRDSTVPDERFGRNSTVPIIGSGGNSIMPTIRSKRNSTVPVESHQNRFPGLLYRRRRVMNPFLIFCVAFILVAVVKKLTK